MAIEIPADWPPFGRWVEDTPVAYLETIPVEDGPPTIETRTNLITNPSAEVNATGWESNSGFGAYDIATIARSTVRAWVGTASVLVTAPAPVVGETWGNFTNASLVAIGQTYTFSAYVWSPVAATFFADVVFVAQGPDTYVPAQTWTRVSVTFSANSVNAFAGIAIAGAPAGFQYWIDGALLEVGDTRRPYFDGATPDVTTPGHEATYSWKGTAHASQSTAVLTAPPTPRRWPVASWDTTREIASSALPGQARHQTGLSVGTGKALVVRDRNDHPWRRAAVFDLSGLHAQILFAPENATPIPTGQFRVAPVQGDVTTYGVDVDLDERQIEGATKTANVVETNWVPPITEDDAQNRVFDPAWLVSQLAAQMGYGVGVAPGGTLSDGSTYSPILDAPMQGSIAPAYPLDIDYAADLAGSVELFWGELDGVIALTAETFSDEMVDYHLNRSIVTSITITADVYGWLDFKWQDPNGPGILRVGVQNRTSSTGEQTLEIMQFSFGSNAGANTSTFSNYAAGAFDPNRPYGIQVQVELIGSPATSSRVRVRRRGNAVWSPWFTHPMANSITTTEVMFDAGVGPRVGDNDEDPLVSRITIVDNAGLSAATLTALFDNTEGENGRIYLEPLYGSSISPWISPDLTTWAAMQEIVNAWQGALITDVYGDLRLLNRYSLTGVGTGIERSIDVGLNFEDLPWVLDYADQADRLVVKYRPVVERQWAGSPDVVPIIWELSEVVGISPQSSHDIFFTLDYIYPVAIKAIPFIRKDFDNGVYHVWDAYRYNNGTGTHITPGDMISMRIDRVTSSTWKIFIVNHTTQPFHMVDNTGTPYLKIRSVWTYDQTAEETIERGVSAGESTSALEIDLSNYVQNAEDANTLADFIWARVNRRAWKARTVNMVPDYRLDLGDVVEIHHSESKMRTNALVSKIQLAGEAGSLTQKVDFVLIPPTWEDFDEAWATYQPNPPGSWNEFDAFWSLYTWNEFDLAPTSTNQSQLEEFL